MTMIQRAGTAQKVFDLVGGGGGGVIKNDENVIFFSSAKKGRG